MVWLFRFYWLVFSIMNWIFQFSRGAGCPCKYQPNEEACMRHWYHWRRPVTYLPIFRNGKRLNPRTSMASNWNLRFLHCCRNLDLFWSFTNGSAASELSSEQGRRKYSSNWIPRWVNQFFLSGFTELFVHVRCIPQQKFAMMFLSKCVIPAVYVKLAGTLRGKPFQANNWQ